MMSGLSKIFYSNYLSQYYEACLNLPNCEVSQSLIDLNEGYINYNSEQVNNTLDTSSNDVMQYNMVTNEFCKDITNENACDQLKQCEWHYDHNKCLVNINYNKYNIELPDNSKLQYHYIPIPPYSEELNNNLSKECSGRIQDECNILCSWNSATSTCEDSLNIIDKDELLKLLNSEVNSCKKVDFRIFGLSLATINFLLSLVIFILI